MDCTCAATPGPHAPHCDGCSAPADRCICDEVPDGPDGRCDTCGTPCDEHGCMADRTHLAAIDPFTD